MGCWWSMKYCLKSLTICTVLSKVCSSRQRDIRDALGAKHLRHLGQHRAAPVLDHVVGEAAEQRIGGDAGEAVRAAALPARI